MAENQSAQQGESAAVHTMKKVYLKDLSFESPNAPAIFNGDGPASHGHQMNFNIRISHNQTENGDYEVTVRLTLHATGIDNQSICLVEVEQAGIFALQGVSAQDLEHFLKIHCPRAIFPFARQQVWSIITAAGFPGLLIQDIDFAAIHQANAAPATSTP